MKTPIAIISYPNLFEAKGFDGSDPKFSAAFIFEEGTDISELEEAVVRIAIAKWGKAAKAALLSGKLNSPFRTDAKPGYPEGCTFFNARSDNRPGVVSRVPDPANDGKPTAITDPGAVIAGAKVIGAVTPYAYDRNGNKGVTFGLDHVQLVRPPTQEERLDGRVAASDTFDADEDAAANLDDLAVNGGLSDNLSDLSS